MVPSFVMRSFSLLLLSGLAVASKVSRHPATKAPAGCRKLRTDDDWPTREQWQAALPGVIQMSGSDVHGSTPDYRMRAKSYADVQAAVKFAASNNIRLSVIATGHDQLGRNDAGSGLLIDLSLLQGARVAKSFTATTQGVPSPNADERLQTIVPDDNVQAAVTFHPAMSSLKLNYGLDPSGLFIVSGTAQGVAVAGGWGQNGGYGPLTAQYGIGADQWLEAKIVTPDGDLKVANAVSNPDLFWAIRGGGGGTFGVVVEATLKAYRTVPMVSLYWYMNSTLTVNNNGGHPPTNDAMMYLLSELPNLQEKGVSAYVYVHGDNVRCQANHPGRLASVQQANEIWGPILAKMQSYPGMTPFQSKHFSFKSYKEFFEVTYGPLETTDDGPPIAHGIVPYDSRLLGPKHLRSPDLSAAFESTGGEYGVLLTAPGLAAGDGHDTSANPGWRNATILLDGFKTNSTNVDGLRKLAPEMGTYINEASTDNIHWSEAFWGSNYPRLSKLKSQIDPNMVLWISPGINADHMQVVNGRVCTVNPVPGTPSLYAPHMERHFAADLVNDRGFIFGDLELIGAQFPTPGTLLGLQD